MIVVAAGRGSRFGGAKPYAPLGGRRVLDWSLDAARRVATGVVLVVAPDRAGPPELGVDAVVVGGDSRSASVRNGLAAVPPSAEIVVVHDAARALAGDDLFARVIAAIADPGSTAEGSVPGVAVVDTLRREGAGTVDRDGLMAVQTPQAFRAGALRRAHGDRVEATDDASLVEAAGGRVVLVPGDPRNLKITHRADLRIAEALVREQGAGPGPAKVRVGMGFDVHRYSPDQARPLVLGGVTFPGRGLDGHSDADPIAHACIDALLGAADLGDIGQHFPDTDPAWSGADSVGLLAEATRRLRGAGWEPGNVDCSVVLDEPKLAPRRAEMTRRLSLAVGAPVSVKGRRSEGLGAIGRGEGVACWAVAVVTAP